MWRETQEQARVEKRFTGPTGAKSLKAATAADDEISVSKSALQNILVPMHLIDASRCSDTQKITAAFLFTTPFEQLNMSLLHAFNGSCQS